MPYRADFDPHGYRITFGDTVTNADLRELAREVAQAEAAAAVVPHRVIDMRAITNADVDFSAIFDIAEQRTAIKVANPIKSALIAPGTVHYGLARMFQAMNRNPDVTVAIFPTEEAALAWLAAPGVAPPDDPWAPA